MVIFTRLREAFKELHVDVVRVRVDETENNSATFEGKRVYVQSSK